ncbi:MAG TPA: hypothetical protein VM261_08780 [Kofleriaceae bacterium]|nr:hypothetical protein [Kofleriaceae bacterium]
MKSVSMKMALFIVAVPMMTVGCFDDAEDASESVSVAEASLTQETVSCAGTQLAWPDPASTTSACTGPWSYRGHNRPCYDDRADAAICGTEWIADPCKVCLHDEWGQTHVSNTTVSLQCNSNPANGPLGCSGNLGSKCVWAGQAARNGVQGDVGIVGVTQTLTGNPWNQQQGGGLYKRLQNCQITLTNAKHSASFKCNSGSQGVCWRTQPATCRNPAFGEAPTECGLDTSTWLTSAPGQSRSDVLAADAYADTSVSGSECTTQEHLPVGTATEAQTRVAVSLPLVDPGASYWTQQVNATAGDEAAARDTIVRHLKHLFETDAHQLTDAQRSAIRALYGAQPSTALACGVDGSPAVPASCLAYGDGKGLNGPMRLCGRLLSSHVPDEVFDLELERCLAVLAQVDPADAAPCATSYRNALDELGRLLVEHQLARIDGSGGGLTGLTPALAAIDAWYENVAALWSAQPARREAAMTRVLAGFWRRVHEEGVALPAAFPTGAAGTEATRLAIDAIFDNQLSVSRQVIAAAFADPPPLTGRPLLALLSDALAPVAARLDEATPYYDLACRYRGCTVGEANEAVTLWRLLGALPVATELTTALDAAPSLTPEWRTTFEAIRDQHGALVAAYRDAAGSSTTTPAEILDGVVAPGAQQLAAVVQQGNLRWNSYAKSGLLVPYAIDVLRTGLQDAKRIEIANQFDFWRSELRGVVSGFRQARGNAANLVLQRIQNQQFLTRVEDEASQLHQQLLDGSHDLEGLQRNQTRAEREHGDFMARYLEQTKRPGWLSAYPVNLQSSVMALHAGAALWTPGTIAERVVPSIAVRDPANPTQPWSKAVAKGDILSFNISGQWAPTCALRAGPVAGSSVQNAMHAMTGPEGYALVWQNGQLTATSYSDSTTNFNTTSTSTSICASASASAVTVLNGATPVASTGASAQACRQTQSGTTVSDTTTSSSGTNTSITASFAGGVRLRNTPFPTMPAGSLLLVETYQFDNEKRIRDVHVVGRQHSILISSPGEVYLVANDLSCGNFDNSALTVNMVYGQSPAGASAALATAMADVLGDLRAAAITHVDQGSITATELEALRSGAYDDLLDACNGCNLDSYPQTIRTMFASWLSHHLAGLERRVRIAATQRQLDHLGLRLVALQHEADSGVTQSRALELMTRWQLADLSGAHLEAATDVVFEFANEYVYPMLQIRYPAALQAIRTTGDGVLDDLQAADWTLPIETFADKAEAVAAVVSSRLRVAVLDGTSRTAPLILEFEKPPLPGAVDEDDDLFGDAAPDDWNKAHASRREMIWEPVYSGGTIVNYQLRANPVFELSPDDVYQDHLGGLFCFEAAPVIRSMAVYVVTGSDSRNAEWNANPRRRDTYPATTRLFTHEVAGLSYRLENPEWASFAVRVLAGRKEDTTATFSQFAAGEHAVEGLSPFGTFSVNLAPILPEGGLMRAATSVMVVMNVEARGATGPLGGVMSCE